MAEKTSRCWPGYEPVKGKPANSQGSCKPKAESKSTPSEKQFQSKRRKQLDNWEASHSGSQKKGVQHLSASGAKKKTKRSSASKTTNKFTATSTRKRAAATNHKSATAPKAARRKTAKRASAKTR